MFHYFQNFSSDAQHFDDFYCSEKSNTCLTSGISDYDLGGEGDLFKAPQPIIEPPLVTLDHMTSAMSLIWCGEDLVSQDIKFANIGLPQFEDFMSDPFYENKDIILAKESSPPSQILDTNNIIEKENVPTMGKITKSVSSDSLTSMNGGGQSRLSSMNFTDNESEKVHCMRRAFSEGYIKPQLINDHISETRMQQLSRYRDKKTKRNFRRQIKYACRKALADSQPRIRGRFAKTEETNT